ncbi:unnamed protein product [Somion occarium]|uniref:Uncharacterized protein n=1 Tax=Somion occarium TaxID=3059160 RepID=A0ABP1CRL6_9APHY
MPMLNYLYYPQNYAALNFKLSDYDFDMAQPGKMILSCSFHDIISRRAFESCTRAATLHCFQRKYLVWRIPLFMDLVSPQEYRDCGGEVGSSYFHRMFVGGVGFKATWPS